MADIEAIEKQLFFGTERDNPPLLNFGFNREYSILLILIISKTCLNKD